MTTRDGGPRSAPPAPARAAPPPPRGARGLGGSRGTGAGDDARPGPGRAAGIAAAALLGAFLLKRLFFPAPGPLLGRLGEVHALAWSPDGRSLLVAEERSGLWVHDLEAGSSRLLPVRCFPSSGHAWLPDGRLSCSGRPEGEAGSAVLVIDPADGAARSVAAGSDAAWSSDGVRVAHRCAPPGGPGARPGGYWALCVTDTATGQTTVVSAREAWGYGLQPGGDLVLFRGSASGCTVARTDGSEARDFACAKALWAPDGRRIVVLRAEGPVGTWLATAPDGSAAEPLFTGPVSQELAAELVLAPDGRRALLSIPLPRAGDANSDLFLAEVGGKGLRRLAPLGTFEGRFAVSPDSRRLAYARLTRDGYEVRLLDL